MQFSYLYILTNATRTYLYVGATDDLSDKLNEHRQIACSAFSRDMQPAHLIYFETFKNIALAENRARDIKKWKERQKWQLIMSANPCLNELLWLDSDVHAA
ncbi:GIY-YIG nuclease family protein [Flavobacterium sp.]|uniref:GIY-YIG nuclease family protein n=1 Tax=Flavobacterium sp. TaxID=239 RepID=UPI0012144898|nr:GIY-YIG nuclease family protein [Flavobacterium sp.]RZJ71568.1 MAG: GIY-YIG nuclease family protein [Flavobacterium sp.]